MAREAHTSRPDTAQDLADAFNVHAALVSAENARPGLRNNPRWQLIRMDAYEAYYHLMGAQ